MEKMALVNEFDEKIIFLPKEETSEELFYGGFRAFPYSDVRANLITFAPIRNLINGALISLPENIKINFPSNLGKRLKEVGKSIGSPKFANQFKIKGDLHVIYDEKIKWKNAGGESSIYKSVFDVACHGMRKVAKYLSLNIWGDGFMVIPEDFLRQLPEELKLFFNSWLAPDSQLVLDGKKYAIIKKFNEKLSQCGKYFQVCALRLDVSVLCKNGGDAVWKIDVRLPGLEVFSCCPFKLDENQQWETMKEKMISRFATFEDAIKELAGV